MNKIASAWSRALDLSKLLDHLQAPLLLLGRLYVARVFILSGLEKLRDWSATLALFHDEYKVPLLSPDVAAVAGTFGETVLPWLVLLGLLGRFGSLGLFMVNAMAVVSYPQLWGFDCPAAIQSHFYWGSLLLALTVFGPGAWSIDGWWLRRRGASARP